MERKPPHGNTRHHQPQLHHLTAEVFRRRPRGAPHPGRRLPADLRPPCRRALSGEGGDDLRQLHPPGPAGRGRRAAGVARRPEAGLVQPVRQGTPHLRNALRLSPGLSGAGGLRQDAAERDGPRDPGEGDGGLSCDAQGRAAAARRRRHHGRSAGHRRSAGGRGRRARRRPRRPRRGAEAGRGHPGGQERRHRRVRRQVPPRRPGGGEPLPLRRPAPAGQAGAAFHPPPRTPPGGGRLGAGSRGHRGAAGDGRDPGRAGSGRDLRRERTSFDRPGLQDSISSRDVWKGARATLTTGRGACAARRARAAVGPGAAGAGSRLPCRASPRREAWS